MTDSQPLANAKVGIAWRLGSDWRDLAAALKIPPHLVGRFPQGSEAYAIWDYLEARDELHALPSGLRRAGRNDLADLVQEALRRNPGSSAGPDATTHRLPDAPDADPHMVKQFVAPTPTVDGRSPRPSAHPADPVPPYSGRQRSGCIGPKGRIIAASVSTALIATAVLGAAITEAGRPLKYLGPVPIPSAGSTASAGPLVKDGGDPTGCTRDARRVHEQAVFAPSGVRIGTLQLVLSVTCDAVWARLDVDQTNQPPGGWDVELTVVRSTDDRTETVHEHVHTTAYYTKPRPGSWRVLHGARCCRHATGRGPLGNAMHALEKVPTASAARRPNGHATDLTGVTYWRAYAWWLQVPRSSR